MGLVCTHIHAQTLHVSKLGKKKIQFSVSGWCGGRTGKGVQGDPHLREAGYRKALQGADILTS